MKQIKRAVPASSATERLFTVSSVAAHLGVSEKTVRREITAGHLSCIRVGPAERQIRVRPSELQRYLRERSQ